MNMYRYDCNLRLLQETPEILTRNFCPDAELAGSILLHHIGQRRYTLQTDDAEEILRCYGIPVIDKVRVREKGEAVRAARRIGFPLTMKVHALAGGRLNRTDVVSMQVKDEYEVCRAFDFLQEQTNSSSAAESCVIVQPILRSPCCELALSSGKTQIQGSIIKFGLAGKPSGTENSYAIGLPPLNQALARRMMEEANMHTHLQKNPYFQNGRFRIVEEILIRFSQLIVDHPHIDFLEIDPLVMTDDGCFVRDARLRLNSDTPGKYQWAAGDLCPPHFSLPPYPFKYEQDVLLHNDTTLHIRPIRGEDEPALQQFLEKLSEDSVFFRFGQPRISMSHDHLARLCQVDCDRDLAFLAIVKGDEEIIIGDARLNMLADLESAELSFLVADQWQSKGIGNMLMEFCITVAGEMGLKTLVMEVMKSNDRMLRFGWKYNFQPLQCSDGDDTVVLQLTLASATKTSCSFQPGSSEMGQCRGAVPVIPLSCPGR